MQEWIVTEQQSGSRIDKMLAEQLEEFTRSYLQKRFLAGDIVVNGKTVKPSYKVMEGDVIHVSVPEAQEPEIVPEPIPLDILYEETERLFKRCKASRELCELRNMINIGYLITRQAMERKESRGLHYTIDYPHAAEEKK